MPAPTVDDVMDALSNVIDPELGLDFVELGLIYGVVVDDGNVHVTFTLTTPGCPIGPQVTEQIEEFVGELDDVRTIESEMVFSRRGHRRRCPRTPSSPWATDEPARMRRICAAARSMLRTTIVLRTPKVIQHPPSLDKAVEATLRQAR